MDRESVMLSIEQQQRKLDKRAADQRHERSKQNKRGISKRELYALFRMAKQRHNPVHGMAGTDRVGMQQVTDRLDAERRRAEKARRANTVTDENVAALARRFARRRGDEL